MRDLRLVLVVLVLAVWAAALSPLAAQARPVKPVTPPGCNGCLYDSSTVGHVRAPGYQRVKVSRPSLRATGPTGITGGVWAPTAIRLGEGSPRIESGFVGHRSVGLTPRFGAYDIPGRSVTMIREDAAVLWPSSVGEKDIRRAIERLD